MAKKDKTSRSETGQSAPKKRRWYHNMIDAYKITKRTYPWISWVMPLLTVGVTGLFIWFAIWQRMNIVILVLFAVTLVILIPMLMLAALVKKAMYRQLSGTVGSVYAVVSQLKRGWITSSEPVAANRQQDLVWRLVGRPGVVLITEGPTGRVRDLVERERKMSQRVVMNVPVHVIHVGTADGQVPLEKLEGRLRRLPKSLHRKEVPEVANRIQAVAAHNRQGGLPHGIDPQNAKISRRALRGK